MSTRSLRVKLRRLLRRIFQHDDPAPRIARGIAAGFFAAAFPLPGLQIPLSLFVAALARGNKAVSVFPQFLANPLTFLPMAYLEFRIGALLWPGRADESGQLLAALKDAAETWTWAAPVASTSRFFEVLGAQGLDALGPLFLGILIFGMACAAVSYPLTIIGVWTWRTRRRAARRAKGLLPRARAPLVLPDLPVATDAEAARREAIAAYALHPEGFIAAERARLLIDGREAFPAMLEAIAGARESVDLETYILAADRAGTRFAEALMRAALRGVRVRLLYDAIGSLGLPQDFVDGMLAAGVRVAVYHPLLLLRPDWAVNRRDHRKILIVDRAVSFTGGLNISDDYAARADGGRNWRDTHVRLDGPAPAAALGGLFEYAWEKAQRLEAGRRRHRSIRELVSALRPRGDAPLGMVVKGEQPGCVAVSVIGNREFRKRRRIRAAYLHAIRNARHYILIENGFFLPDRGIRRALAKAVKRGVEVAVAVSRVSDPRIGAVAGRVLYSELLAAGVRIYEWPEPMLHAKTAVIDDAWSVVGSYNINSRSLFHDLEAVVVIADPGFARGLRLQKLKDLAQCREVTQDEHESRSWRQMLLESAAYMLRYWL